MYNAHPTPAVFGSRLKRIRKEQKLTQREFSSKIGVTAASLSAYENGTQIPSIEIAFRIAITFHVSLDWLCGIKKEEDRWSGTYLNFDLPATLEGLLLMVDWSVLRVLYSQPGEDDEKTAEVEICSDYLREFIAHADSIANLFQGGAIDGSLYATLIDETVSRYARLIDREMKELNDPSDELPVQTSSDEPLPF